MVRNVGGRSGNGGRGGNVLTILLAGSLGCQREAPPPDTPPGSAPAAAPSAPAAERVLTAPGGVEVWFGDARDGRDSAGATCVERSLEIRGPAGRRIVPLLYTLDTPSVLDDSTIRARLFTNCRPGPTYRVDLRTGLPVRKD